MQLPFSVDFSTNVNFALDAMKNAHPAACTSWVRDGLIAWRIKVFRHHLAVLAIKTTPNIP